MKPGSSKSTETKLQKSKSVKGKRISREIYAKRIAAEKRRAVMSASFINIALIFYASFSAYFLVMSWAHISDFNMRIIYGLAAGSLVAGYLWTRREASLGRLIVERTNPVLKSLRAPKYQNWLKTPSGVFSLSILLITMVLGWEITDMSFYSLFSADGLAGAQRIFGELFTPELGILQMVVKAMIQTIFIALMATLIAIPIAFVVSFMCARNLMRGSKTTMAVYNTGRFIFNFTRSVEPLIWAIIFSVWVGIGPFAGMLALMIHSIASLAKLYSEQIESIDRGPLEAIEATGANKIQVIWYAVVPQIVLPYLSYTIYRWDINVRMATIIGLVGGGGVGTLLMQYQGLARWSEVGTIVIAIAIVVWFMDYMSAKIREAIY